MREAFIRIFATGFQISKAFTTNRTSRSIRMKLLEMISMA
jgi:hypothetical protein